MKRAIGALLTVCMCLSSVSAVMAEDHKESIADGMQYKVISGLGLLPEEVIEKTDDNGNITRSEFAAILYAVLNYGEREAQNSVWYSEFFGNYDINNPAEPLSETSYFDDVDSNDTYYEAINYVYGIGLIADKGNNSFMPDADLDYISAARAIEKLLGYSDFLRMNGNKSILSTASDIGLYIKKADDVMTVSDTVMLLYSALDKNIITLEINGTSHAYKKSDTDFMSKWLQIQKTRGILIDNGITSLGGDSSVNYDNIIVDDMVFTNKCNTDIRGFIGYQVDVYSSAAQETIDEAYVVLPTNKNNTVTFDIIELEKYSDYRFEYTYNGRSKSVKLNYQTYMIYNGKNLSEWSNEDFLFNDGTVTVIENGSGYTVVNVENYSNWIVSSYSASSKRLYNKAKDSIAGNGDEYVDLTDAEENHTLFMEWSDGSTASLDELKENLAVDIIINGTYVKMIITNNILNDFKVTSISRNTDYDGYYSITGESDSYYVNKSFDTLDGACVINTGRSYSLILNRKGIVVWIDSKYLSSESVGYLVSVIMDDESEDLILKIFTVQGVMNRFRVLAGKKVSYTDEYGEKFKLTPEKLYVKLFDYEGIITYKQNDEKFITAVSRPSEKKTNDTVLQKIYSGTEMTYKNAGKFGMFGRLLFITSDTKVFYVPESNANKGDTTAYKILSKDSAFATDSRYSLTGYAMNKDSRVASYVVYKNDAETSWEYSPEYLNFMLVDEITSGLTPDDEPCDIITGWKCGYTTSVEKVTLYSKYDKTDSSGSVVSALETAYDTPKSKDERGNLKTYKIQRGDLIRYITDVNGECITGAELFFRLKGTNPAFETGRNGFLAGSIGYYSNENTFSNPYSICYYGDNIGKTMETSLTHTSDKFVGYTSVYYGFVYNCVDGIYECTTKDLSGESKLYDPDSDKYLTFYYNTMDSTIQIDIDGKSMSVNSTPQPNIRTYKNVGDECSRIIRLSVDGNDRLMFVINGDL